MIWVIEFRNGSYLQSIHAGHSGPAATAKRFESETEANDLLTKHEWIAFYGGTPKLIRASRYTDLEVVAREIQRPPAMGIGELQARLEALARAIWTQGWDCREEQGALAGAFGHANRYNPYRRPAEERKCRACGTQPMHTERGRCEDCGDCQGCGDEDCGVCHSEIIDETIKGSEAIPDEVTATAQLFPEKGFDAEDVMFMVHKMRDDDEPIPNLKPRVTFETPTETRLRAQEPEPLLTLQERNDQYVRHVLQACGGSVTNAARTLGIGRATLYRWLAKLGVSFDEREAERKLARRIKYLGRPVRTM